MEDRNINQLLQLLLSEIKKGNFKKCLCWTVNRLWFKDIITNTEVMLLHDYIDNNRPIKWYQLSYSYKYRNDPFYWKLGKKTPRILWLLIHINKTKHVKK